MPLCKLRFQAADAATGQAAADLLAGLAEPAALAVTVFEHELPAFRVEAYYAEEPPLGRIAQALASLGPGLGAPTLEAVPDENWVALSQAALPPVAAGRFVVHGSHDRARVGLRQRAIEIEAGEAFGTGHNATTALCLEALDALARRRHCARARSGLRLGRAGDRGRPRLLAGPCARRRQ
jgi:ribosomal protein L11 methyltransferase